MKIITELPPIETFNRHQIIKKNIKDSYTKSIEIDLEIKQKNHNITVNQKSCVLLNNDVVAAVIHDPVNNCIALVSQVRPVPVFKNNNLESLEIIAGILEENTEPCDMICTEILEETSLLASSICPLGSIYSDPVQSTSKIHYFYVEADMSCLQSNDFHGISDDGESISLFIFHQNLISPLIKNGYINDTLSITGLMLASEKIN
jgi:nudix-type nucleoside diphosphatase (YffH/AdpP family)